MTQHLETVCDLEGGLVDCEEMKCTLNFWHMAGLWRLCKTWKEVANIKKQLTLKYLKMIFCTLVMSYGQTAMLSTWSK